MAVTGIFGWVLFSKESRIDDALFRIEANLEQKFQVDQEYMEQIKFVRDELIKKKDGTD